MEAPLHAAAPLNHPIIMKTDCNANNTSLNNAELEVKKLQALIRKLEKQNEQLRTRASNGCTGSPHRLSPSPPCIGGSGGGGGCCLPTPLPALMLCQSSSLGVSLCSSDGSDEDEEEDGEPTALDEVDILDLDSLFSSWDEDAETWLYVSSRASGCVDSPLTPVQWCRMVLDRPKSGLEVVRRSLSLKLDQVSRWRSMFSASPPPAALPFNGVAGVPPLCSSPLARACSTPQLSERHAPPLSSPVHPILQRAVSPMGKEAAAPSDRTPTFFPHHGNRNRSLQRSASSPQPSMDSGLTPSMMDDDHMVLQGYKLNDLTDVQVMARLQEESLRQDYASSSSSSTPLPRRSRSLSLHLSGLSAAPPGLDEEDEEEEEDYALLPPPQPRLTRLTHSHTFSSIRDWQRSTSSLVTPPSTPSTPPYPSAGLAFPAHHHHAPGMGMVPGMASCYAADLQQSFRPGSDKLRRSMPNLVKAPSLTCVPSIPATHNTASPLLRNSQSFDSSSGLARLQSSIPSPGQLQNRVQSVGNFVPLSRQPHKATAYVSPTIKGSAFMSTATSLQSLNNNNSSCGGVGAGSGAGGVGGGVGVSSGIPLLHKVAGGGGGTLASNTATPPRSSLPRPASFIGTTSSTPRGKMSQPARSLLTPPKSLSTFSALRDTSWRDGCY